MKKVLIAFVVLLAISLAGCVSEKQTYRYEKNPAWNLTLYPDRTYLMYIGEQLTPYTGDYSIIDNGDIIIRGGLGTAYTLHPVGNKLIDKDNDTWVKI